MAVPISMLNSQASPGPYSGFNERLSVGGVEVDFDDSWRRIDFFPKTFLRSSVECHIRRTEKVALDPETLKLFQDYRDPLDTLYAVDSRFAFLCPGDIIAVADTARTPDESDRLLQILHIQKSPLPEYLDDHDGDYRIKRAAKRQIGREIGEEEQVTILEVQTTYARDLHT